MPVAFKSSRPFLRDVGIASRDMERDFIASHYFLLVISCLIHFVVMFLLQ